MSRRRGESGLSMGSVIRLKKRPPPPDTPENRARAEAKRSWNKAAREGMLQRERQFRAGRQPQDWEIELEEQNRRLASPPNA